MKNVTAKRNVLKKVGSFDPSPEHACMTYSNVEVMSMPHGIPYAYITRIVRINCVCVRINCVNWVTVTSLHRLDLFDYPGAVMWRHCLSHTPERLSRCVECPWNVTLNQGNQRI